jgi:hypothetical protein
VEDRVNILARELGDVIGEVVAASPLVEAVREKARVEGYEMRVTLEAIIAFVTRGDSKHSPEKTTALVPVSKANQEYTANDRRFMRSLRIAADDVKTDGAHENVQ